MFLGLKFFSGPELGTAQPQLVLFYFLYMMVMVLANEIIAKMEDTQIDRRQTHKVVY